MGQMVYDIGTAFRRTQEWRTDHALDCLWRVEPRPWQYSQDVREMPLRAAKSAIETVQADICGRQKIKPMVVTDGGTWKVRRRAKRKTKFIEGVLSQSYKQYPDAWALMSDVFFDAATWGTGVVAVSSDADGVCLERAFQHEFYVDPLAAQNGMPADLFRVRAVARDELASWFDEDDSDVQAAIAEASTVSRDELWNPDIDYESSGGHHGVADMVRVVEAWYHDPGSGEGRHVIAIDRGVALLDEEWNRGFPFVFLTWSRSRARFWGVSLVDEIRQLENELNRTFTRIQDSIHLRSGRRLYYEQGTVEPEMLESNDIESIIAVESIEKRPQVEQPPPVSRAEFQWMEQMRSLILEMPGVSLQQATAKKEAGLESGRAIQYASDIGTRRQGTRVAAWEAAWVRLATCILEEVAAIAADDPEFAITWKGKEFLKEIHWKDCVLEDDKFIMSIMPANHLPVEPAGRIAFIEQLFNSQIISASTFRRLSELPDLEAEFDKENAEYEYVMDLIDRMLDAETPRQLADAWEAPEPLFTDISAVLVTFARAYWEAKRQKAPEQNLRLLRNYMQAISFNIEQAQSQMQQEAGPQGPAMPPQEAQG